MTVTDAEPEQMTVYALTNIGRVKLRAVRQETLLPCVCGGDTGVFYLEGLGAGYRYCPDCNHLVQLFKLTDLVIYTVVRCEALSPPHSPTPPA